MYSIRSFFYFEKSLMTWQIDSFLLNDGVKLFTFNSKLYKKIMKLYK